VAWLVPLILLLFGQPSSSQPLDTSSIFVNQNLEWQAQPGKLAGYPYRFASGTLLIFRADGEFDRLDGTLVRQQEHGPISINYRRSYRVSVGIWNRVNNEEIRVISHVVYVTIPKVGEVIPGNDTQSDWRVHGQASGRIAAAIDGGGSHFIPLHSITASEVRALDQVIRLHLSEVSAQKER